MASALDDWVLAQFENFDQNGDGTIDRAELLTAIKMVVEDRDEKEKWTEERVDRLLQAADTNRDGVIQYEEFLAFVSGNQSDECDFRRAAERAVAVTQEATIELVRLLSAKSRSEGKPEAAGALDQLAAVPWEQKEPAFTLIVKLLNNVVQDPSNPKFRRMKKTNKTLAAKVFSVPGCTALLLAAGFTEDGEELVLPEGVEVAWVVELLNTFGKEEGEKKAREERDARIAAVRAEEEKGKQLRAAGSAPLSGDEERQKIMKQAEYDKQERAAREKLVAEGYREENFVPAEKGGGAVTRFGDIGVDINRGGG